LEKPTKIIPRFVTLKSKDSFPRNKMKILDSHSICRDFLKELTRDRSIVTDREFKTIETLINGIITQENPSPNKIHDEVVKGASKRTFYRNIHRLASQMPTMYSKFISSVQENTELKMQKSGYLSIDEHIVPHSSQKMEGVDYFYSTTANGQKLGHSLITTHYFGGSVEYPVRFQFYRRKQELERWDKLDLYNKKNAIAREQLGKVFALPRSPKTILMDSFFMTKDNCKFLQKHDKSYISRPRRNWKCTYQHKKQSLTDLFENIPEDEFTLTTVKNPKTKKTKQYLTATRNVFFSKIGTHRVVFVKDPNPKEKDLFQNAEKSKSSKGVKFRVFVTNDMSLSAGEILSIYSLRWTIETGYRDMSQNLGLHGCKWRELSGQYCFIGLTFLCYIFLVWARQASLLNRYNSSLKTLGEMRTAFRHYCQEEFSIWLSHIRKQCGTCPMANWIHKHVFTEKGSY